MSYITLDTTIEELVEQFPEAVGFLTQRNVRCMRCGEPLWGILRELFRKDGIMNPQSLVDELNEFIEEGRD